MELNIQRFAIDLSTAGIYLSYCVEETAGTRPTSGYTKLTGVKSTPSLNPAPETLETTTLEATEWKTYIDGLKDPGGALEFTFNLTAELIDQWDTLMTAYNTAKAAGKKVYFAVNIPQLKVTSGQTSTSQAYVFPGNPSAMGLPETSVSAVLETTNYITPTGPVERVAMPTLAQ